VFLCRVSGAGFTFITQVMMARWMGATELGIYVYAFSLAMLLSTLASLGLPAASLRFISEYLASGKTAFINGFLAKGRLIILLSSLCLAVVAFTVLIVLSVSISVVPIPAIDNNIAFTVLIALSDSLGDYFRPVVLSFVCIPFIALFRFHDRVAHAFSWFALSFLPSMTLRPLIFLIALYVMWELTGHLSAETSMIVQFCVIVAITIVQYFLLRPRLKKTINNKDKELDLALWLRVSTPLLFITVFTQYFPELSIIIIGSDLPPDQIAIYNACYRVALLIGFVYNAVSAAIVPKASHLHAQGDVAGMQRYITQATQLNFFLSVIGVILFVFGGKILLGFFGKEFIIGYPALLVLAAAQLFLAGVGPVAI
jgi:O-antigen/teichoic acid export membrane protein